MCFINGSATLTHMLHFWHWQSCKEFVAMFTHLHDSDHFPSIFLPQDKTGLTKTRPSGNTKTHIMSWRSVHMPHTGSCIPTFYSPRRLSLLRMESVIPAHLFLPTPNTTFFSTSHLFLTLLLLLCQPPVFFLYSSFSSLNFLAYLLSMTWLRQLFSSSS